jgi:hypothetical protein
VGESSVVVATFWSLVEAKLASELLASAGFDVRLSGEGLASAHPLLAPALGGVRVLVAADQAEQAIELLRLRGVTRGAEAPGVDSGSLEDEALEAEPADESVVQFLDAQKRRAK